MRKPKTPPEDEGSVDAALAQLKRAVEERFARLPPQDEAVAPKPARIETAAEKELFRIELAYRVQAVLCSDPGRCARHRCRRLARCQELADMAPMVEEQRALVAKERAAAGATAAADGSADASAAVAAAKSRGARRRRRQRKH